MVQSNPITSLTAAASRVKLSEPAYASSDTIMAPNWLSLMALVPLSVSMSRKMSRVGNRKVL